MYIDIHAHLNDAKYDGKVKTLVEDCINANVKRIVDSAFDFESAKVALDNASEFSEVYCVLGIHPENVDSFDNEFCEFLKSNATNPKCVGIGEIGLDYHYEGYDKARQAEVYVKQLEIANQLGLPFVVHSRDASSDNLRILQENRHLINNGFLMHCYSESREQAFNYLDLGAYFSFGGVITFKNAKKDEIVKAIPLNKLLVETDSPYLSPEPNRGKVNSPTNVVYVYKKISQILQIDEQILIDKVVDNAKTLFKKIN